MKISSISYSVPSRGYSNEEFVKYWIKNLKKLSYFKRPIYKKLLLRSLKEPALNIAIQEIFKMVKQLMNI